MLSTRNLHNVFLRIEVKRATSAINVPRFVCVSIEMLKESVLRR